MTGPGAAGIDVPLPYRVQERRDDTADTATLGLEPVAAPIDRPLPGQFTMLSVFGRGEAPISVSGLPGRDRPLQHTIRAAGPLTSALRGLSVGATVGVRGPFGTGWPIAEAGPASSVVVVAGGIGLAPLLPAIRHLDAIGAELAVLIGARRPGDLMADDDLTDLARRHPVLRTVDVADPTWRGDVGVVTELLRRVPFPVETASALVCGPEVMMRFAARMLTERGLPPERIHVALERNMHCGRGACGHCQLGPLVLCTDGPVVPYAVAEPLLAVRAR